jgi:hypothetical protein
MHAMIEPAVAHASEVERSSETECSSLQDAKAALTAYLLEDTGACVAVEEGTRVWHSRVSRLALLNEAHTVNQFLLADRGIARYPPYTIHRTRSAFTCLEQLQEYESALQVLATLLANACADVQVAQVDCHTHTHSVHINLEALCCAWPVMLLAVYPGARRRGCCVNGPRTCADGGTSGHLGR